MVLLNALKQKISGILAVEMLLIFLGVVFLILSVYISLPLADKEKYLRVGMQETELIKLVGEPRYLYESKEEIKNSGFSFIKNRELKENQQKILQYALSNLSLGSYVIVIINNDGIVDTVLYWRS